MKAFIGLLMWFGDLACVRAVAGGSIEDSSDPFPGVLFPEEAGEWLVNAEAATVILRLFKSSRGRVILFVRIHQAK